jgi:methylated-DNA-[protein]-cysteine S-methyltransferase
MHGARQGGPMAQYTLFPTPIGECAIAWRADAVVATHLPGESATATAARLATRARATPGAPPAAIQGAIASITALLSGERADLMGIECDFSGIEPFAAKVYRATRAIAAGETRTYGAIAAQLGEPRLARGVGQALGRNPFPIIVPCHRVMGANDKLTGFSAPGGVATKLRLLAIEGVRPGQGPGLFDDLPLAVKPQE